MPLYLCNARPGAVSDTAKAQIAGDITRIHCEATGAPPAFVHVFFFEDGLAPDIGDGTIALYGNIRRGRTDAQKDQIKADMRHAVHQRTNVPLDGIGMSLQDVPASWVMEGGDIMPEPGQEAAWLVAHEAKMAAAKSA